MHDDDPWLWLEDVQGEQRPGLGARAQCADARSGSRPGPASTPRASASWTCSTRATASRPSRAAATSSTTSGRTPTHPRGLWRRTTLDEYRKAAAGLGDRARPRRAGPRPRARTGSGAAPSAWARTTTAACSSCRAAAPMRRWCASSTSARARFVEGGFSLPEAKSDVDWARRRHALRRHRFRPRLAHRFGLPAHHQALAARPAAGRGRDGVRGAAQRRRRQRAASTARPASSARCSRARPTSSAARSSCCVDGQLRKLRQARRRARWRFWYGQVLLRCAATGVQGGRTWPRGALLAATPRPTWTASAQWHALFTPTATRSLAGYALLRHTVLLELLDNVAGRLRGAALRRQPLAARARSTRPSPARCTRRACTTRWCRRPAGRGLPARATPTS